MSFLSIAGSGAAKTMIAVTVSLHPGAAHHPSHFATVRAGDSLSSISQREYGSAASWPALWWANRKVVSNPSVIQAGERLQVPASHQVKLWLTREALAAIPAAAPAPAPDGTHRPGRPRVTSGLLRSVVEGMPAEFAGPEGDFRTTRRQMAPLHGHPLSPDTTVERSVLGGVPVARVSRPSSDDRRGLALFAHGGAFVSCDLEAYLFYAEFVAEWTGLPVVTADYRLAPEHRGPAALDDCVSVYRAVLASGQDPDRLLWLGDSCGGGLALSTVATALGQGEPVPAGVVSLSGWVDLDTAGYGPTPRDVRDAFITEGFLRARARDYVGPLGDPRSPWASPARGPLEGLPPLLLQVGETDLCRLDAERLSRRAGGVGVDARFDVVAGGIHGVQGLVNLGVPEAVAAWESVRAFADEVLPPAPVD